MAGYAYYALHKLKILPSALLDMDIREKAFVIAAIKVKMENDAKEQKKAERRRR